MYILLHEDRQRFLSLNEYICVGISAEKHAYMHTCIHTHIHMYMHVCFMSFMLFICGSNSCLLCYLCVAQIHVFYIILCGPILCLLCFLYVALTIAIDHCRITHTHTQAYIYIYIYIYI